MTSYILYPTPQLNTHLIHSVHPIMFPLQFSSNPSGCICVSLTTPRHSGCACVCIDFCLECGILNIQSADTEAVFVSAATLIAMLALAPVEKPLPSEVKVADREGEGDVKQCLDYYWRVGC